MAEWFVQTGLLTLTVFLFGIHGLKKTFAGTGLGGVVRQTLVTKLTKIITRL
jgi:hypothetical protein